MDVKPKPIPAFYCCYLLRSTIRHASLYVGSTPNPARRLGQHNGMTKGGANRTARTGLRPWEMTCIVSGFPSNIAALQFEWAWQNAHLTRRIADHDRVSTASTRTKLDSATGRTRRRKVRPAMSLADRLSNLHLLLCAPSFVRWPLELRFFAPDVHRAWIKRCEDLEDDLNDKVKVVVDLPAASAGDANNESAATGIAAIDPTYASLKEHVDKSLFLLADGEDVACSVCNEKAESTQAVLVCSNPACRAASHMSCLSSHFLQSEPCSDLVLPKTGKCPQCASELSWVDLVREMSLRIRAEKDLAKLLKKPRSRKKAAAIISEEEQEEEEEDDEDLDAGDFVDEPLRHEADHDDAVSVASVVSLASEPGILSQREARMRGGLDDVVEDSESESIDFLR